MEPTKHLPWLIPQYKVSNFLRLFLATAVFVERVKVCKETVVLRRWG